MTGIGPGGITCAPVGGGGSQTLYFSGVRNNVAVAELAAQGFSQCFNSQYATAGASLTQVLAQCSGSQLVMACRATGSSTLLVAATGFRADVLFDTGAAASTVHTANGVNWYFNTSLSWGYAPAGLAVNKNSCDIETASQGQRMCWHTSANAMLGGYSCGTNIQLNSSTAFEKVIYQR